MGETGVPREKTSRSQGENQQQINSTHILRRRRDLNPERHWWEAIALRAPTLRRPCYRRKSISIVRFVLIFQSNCYAEG